MAAKMDMAQALVLWAGASTLYDDLAGRYLRELRPWDLLIESLFGVCLVTLIYAADVYQARLRAAATARSKEKS